jgi:hypothetical protein
MRLTENTKVKIRVPKHLYEAIQAELDMNRMKEGDDYMEEDEHVNEIDVPQMAQSVLDGLQNLDMSSFSNLMSQLGDAVGMTGKEFQNTLGGILGIGTTAAGLTTAALKDKKAGIKSTVKQMEEVQELEETIDMETLLEAVNDAAKKKKMKLAKEKEVAAKKKAEDDKKKKEAEAKKKAAVAKKK